MLWQPLSEHPTGECSCQDCREDDKTNDQWIEHDRFRGWSVQAARGSVYLAKSAAEATCVRPMATTANSVNEHLRITAPRSCFRKIVPGVRHCGDYFLAFFSFSLACQAAEMRPSLGEIFAPRKSNTGVTAHAMAA